MGQRTGRESDGKHRTLAPIIGGGPCGLRLDDVIERLIGREVFVGIAVALRGSRRRQL